MPPAPADPITLPPHSDDLSLVRRMRDGDEAALGMLFDRWGRTVYTLVLHIVSSVAVAEDIVETTFWHAWTDVASFDGRSMPVVNWLLALGRTQALASLRSRPNPAAAVAPATIGVSSLDTEGAGSELADRQRRFARALGELSSGQRRVLELAYFRGQDLETIAQHVEQPTETVAVWIRDAGRQLREALLRHEVQAV